MNRPLFLHRILLRFYFLFRILIRFYNLLRIFISVYGALDTDPLLLRKTAKKILVECGFGQFNMYFVAWSHRFAHRSHLELPNVLSFFHLWCFLTLERTFAFTFAALYGVLFVSNQEASFANYRLWESLGFVITFAYQSFICVSVKIYIMLAVLILGMALYYYVEVSTATYFLLPFSISVENKINSHCVKICDATNVFLFA